MKPIRVAGGDILQAISENQDLTLYEIQECSAVYFWRKNFRPPREAVNSQTDLVCWLERIKAVLYGQVIDKPVSHFLTIKELRLQPAEWSPNKRQDLEKFAASPKRRRFLCDYLEMLAELSPPLYVGETGNLVMRTRDHLAGLSKFGQFVNLAPDLNWSDLDLHYVRIGNVSSDLEDDSSQSKHTRTLLETIATDITVAGMVSRRG